MFKRLFLTILVSLVMVSTAMATTITLTNYADGYGADIWARGQTMSMHQWKPNSYITPMNLELDGKDYTAFCVDFFSPIWSGTWNNATISSASSYMNANYVDPQHSLEYAIYNLYHNWDASVVDSETKSYAQLNIWDTLYDYNPVANMHLDRDFMYWNIKDDQGNDYTNQFNSNSPYQNQLLNARSNQSYEVASFIDEFSVVTFGSKGDEEYQTLLIRTGSPVPEPATMMMFGLGLLGISGLSRKRSKK